MKIINKQGLISKTMITGSKLFSIILFSIVISACGSNGKHESTGEFVDNSVITMKVKTKLLADPEIKGLPITVKSFKGKVQLSGFVNNAANAKKAEEIAYSTEGVKSVINNLVVK